MNTDFMFVIEEYEKAGKQLVDDLKRKYEESAQYMDAEELEEARKNIEGAEAALVFQVAMAEKIDQIHDMMEMLLGKI